MPHRLRAVTSDELALFMSVMEAASGRGLSDEVLQDALAMYDVDRTLAAFDDGVLVGGTGSDLLELTLPGLAVIPVARITHTGVLPTHRRRGLVTELFETQVRALRDEGLAVAVFTTSGPGIYRRVGYAPASQTMDMVIEGEARLEREVGAKGEYRMADVADVDDMDELPILFDAHRRVTPGQVARSPSFWTVWRHDRPRYREAGTGDRTVVAWDDRGYLTYRLTADGDALVVEDLIAVDDEARLALWEWCLGLQQTRRVRAHNLPLDEPLLWALRDPRAPRVSGVGDFLWVRVLDVARALEARAYPVDPVDDVLVLDVVDQTCPANTGRWRLDGTSCTKTEDEPDVVLDIAELGAVYLGGVSFTSLARAGRVRARDAAVLARADAMFSSSPRPWTVTSF